MKIDICGVPFSVTFAPKNNIDHDGEGKPLYGQICYPKHSIRIGRDWPNEQQQRTILHEILHGVIDALDIRALLSNKGTTDESAVKQLSIGLHLALKSIGVDIVHALRRQNMTGKGCKGKKHTPIVSKKQAGFFGAEYARAKEGKKTKSGMGKKVLKRHLEEWGDK